MDPGKPRLFIVILDDKEMGWMCKHRDKHSYSTENPPGFPAVTTPTAPWVMQGKANR